MHYSDITCSVFVTQLLGLLAAQEESPWLDPWLDGVEPSTLELPILTIPESPKVGAGSLVGYLNYKLENEIPKLFCDNSPEMEVCCQIIDIVPGGEGKAELRTKVELDFENQTSVEPSCYFYIGITELQECAETSSCKTLQLKVENVNDVPPMFVEYPSTGTFQIEEGVMKDVIFEVVAEDTEFPNRGLQLTFQTNANDVPFKLTETSPKHWSFGTTEPLDYESYRFYSFTFILQDELDKYDYQLTSNFTVTIQVVDVGDTSPEWTKICRSKVIKENFNLDEIIFELRAEDVDSEGNTIVYNIDRVTNQVSDFTEMFDISVDSDSKLAIVKANQNLDREDPSIQGSFNFQFVISAREIDNCVENCDTVDPLSCFLRLEDENDNYPIIGQTEYKVTKDENFKQDLFAIEMSDIDQPDLGYNQYEVSIVEEEYRSHFAISDTTPQGNRTITISCIDDFLDYEQRQTIAFTIKAADAHSAAPGMSSSARLLIQLQDVNDNPPEFEPESYAAEINEDLADLVQDQYGYKIDVLMKATDRDVTAEFGTPSIEYQLTGGEDDTPPNLYIVKVEAEAGQPVAYLYADSKFDFEQKQTYRLKVIARDQNGSGQNTDEAVFLLTIRDVNDEIPVIDTPTKEICVYENNPSLWPDSANCNFKGLELKGTDRDAGSDLDIYIGWEESYAFKDGADVINKDLFKETFEVHKVSDTTIQEITSNLVVSSAKFIDKETVDFLFLRIYVVDKNGVDQSTSVLLNITVADIDDSKPEFSSPSKFTVMESFAETVEETSQDVKITIVDPDQYVEQGYTFSLQEMDDTPAGLYVIEQDPDDLKTILLSTLTYLDRETLTGVLVYNVSVEDLAGNKNWNKVMITVEDMNDCTPYFEPQDYTLEVVEGTESGTVVDQLKGLDEDVSGKYNAESLIYVITFNEKNAPFIIEKSTGEIKVSLAANQEIDREKEEEYSIIVRAQDSNGNPGYLETNFNTDAKVKIIVKDIDDTPPTFINTGKYEYVTIDNIKTVGTKILDFEGQDLDLDSSFTFNILEKEDDFPGTIQDSSLILDKSLKNPEVMKNFSYVVQILDNSGMKDELTCSLYVADVNDNSPVFTYPPDGIDIWVNDEAETGKPLVDFYGDPVNVTATDADVSPVFNKVTYDLSVSEEAVRQWLEINPNTGIFSLKRSLTLFPYPDPDDNTIMIAVQAHDENIANLVRKNLKLRVDRDYPPKFSQDIDLKEIKENTENVQLQLQTATDKNNEEHPSIDWVDQDICYFILEGNEKEVFEVGLKTNILHNVQTIDSDCGLDCQRYVLKIGASNNCDSPPNPEDLDETGIISVTIDILDENDNIPVFVEGKRSAGVTTEDTSNTILLQLQALDPDSEDVEKGLTFSMNTTVGEGSVGLNIPLPFTLTSGKDDVQIKLNFNPNSNMKGYFNVAVTALDNIGHTVTTELKIVMITPEDVCQFSFGNSKFEIEEHQNEIMKVFEEYFPFSFTIDKIEGTVYRDDDPDITFITSHFLNSTTIQPINKWSVMVEYDKVENRLSKQLYDMGINLRLFETDHTESEPLFSVSMTILIVLTTLFGLMFGFLLTAYCIRTNNLERKVKAMETVAEADTNLSKNDKIFLSALQENAPGANEYAEEGANPIWQAAMESNDFDEHFKFGDTSSLSSGDSILIGIEEQNEFRDYKDLDVDMDLYSKVNRKYKTLDEYQAPDETKGVFTLSSGRTGGGNPLYESDGEISS